MYSKNDVAFLRKERTLNDIIIESYINIMIHIFYIYFPHAAVLSSVVAGYLIHRYQYITVLLLFLSLGLRLGGHNCTFFRVMDLLTKIFLFLATCSLANSVFLLQVL